MDNLPKNCCDEANIAKVVSERLCVCCGACMAVCPENAIAFNETTGGLYLPSVAQENCSRCGLCLRVCPGIHFGPSLTQALPVDPFAGNVLGCWVGKATDPTLFHHGQSGGVASAILTAAMESHEIERASIVAMAPGNPPRPVARWASSTSEILEGQRSKYCPVPILSGLRSLSAETGPIGFVGLPCHLHGLANLMDHQHEIRQLAQFKIGLICERVMTLAAIDYLIFKAGLNKSVSSVFHFKDKKFGTWPGDVHIETGNGDIAILSSKHRFRIKDYFTPPRCWICFDKMNVYSDITLGDPHGIPGFDREQGESLVIARNEKGLKIIHDGESAGWLNLRKIDYGLALEGQGISQKRADWHGYSQAWKETGRRLPDYYGLIRGRAPRLAIEKNKNDYTRKLQWSLSLDDHSSRQALLNVVDRKFLFQDVIHKGVSAQALKPIILPLKKGIRTLAKAQNVTRRELFGSVGRSGLMIEITNTDFVNKGAQLMLLAILDNLRRSIPEVNFAFCPKSGPETFQERSRLGLYQKVGFPGWLKAFNTLGRLAPTSIRKMYGLVSDDETDVIMDASGYRYFDKGGGPLSLTIEMVKNVRRWRRSGKKIIFMPQAFGPFATREIRREFPALVENADMIYARDTMSYDHIVNLVGARQNVKIAPDFTITLEGKMPPGFRREPEIIAVVPNCRMIDRTSEEQSKAYVPFMVACMKYLLQKGFKPFILIHEGQPDLLLAHEIVGQLGKNIDIVMESDPQYAKGILGSCLGVIGSRFHALVSALSQGVPSLATGWSHKYPMLMKDFDFEEGLLSVSLDEDLIRAKMDLIIDDRKRTPVAARIIAASEKQKERTKAMWEEIKTLILETRV